MRSASFTASQLRDAGCDIRALRNGGYSVKQLRGCGCKAGELMRECFVSTMELRAAGYSAEECIASGVTVSTMSQFSGRNVRHG
jgi:intracellular multiplication protein IcmE